MEPIEGSETSAIINQRPGNYPKGNLLQKIVTTAYYFGFRCSVYGLHQAFYGSHVCPSVCDRVRTHKGLDGCLSELDTKDFLYMYITEEFHLSATLTQNSFFMFV